MMKEFLSLPITNTTAAIMQNYLLVPLNAYFKETLPIKGRLEVTASFITNFKEQLQKENPQNRDLISTITTYRDLSAINATENLFSPNFLYLLDVTRLDEEITIVISQHCCTAVARAYEVFESYLVSLLTEYFFHNQDKLVTVNLLKANLIIPKEEIRRMLKLNKHQGTNNKGLLAMIRKLSPFFKQVEEKNIHNINISHWFDLYSMVRHTLTHNRQVISHRLLDYLNKQKANALFDQQFQRRKIDQDVHIFLEKDPAGGVIDWLNAFAHLLFNSLSKERGLPPHVPQYVPRPWY